MHGVPKYPAGFAQFDYVNPEAPKGGTLRQAVIGSFDTLNGTVVKGLPAPGLTLATETLLTRSADEPFTLYGLLAESVEVPEDRSAVTFRLNPAARWHDGSPVTADDVLFSLDSQRTMGTPNRRLYYGKVALAERLDERTVRLTFRPEADGGYDREMPLILGLLAIHQKAWWQGRPYDRTTLDPPMGSGPYRIAGVEPGRRIVYERVAGYWGRDLPVRRGLFNADRMVFEMFRDDTVALEAFKSGQLDLRREADPVKWADGYTGPALADGRIVLAEFPHGRPETVKAILLNERRPPFDRAAVREALGLATDFTWIGRTLFHGRWVRTASHFPNSELAATGLPAGEELAALEPFRDRLPPALFKQPFALPATDGSGPTGQRANLRRALALLEGEGWRLRDGRLSNAEGRPLTFEVLLGDPADERVALEYARTLTRLGVQATVRTVDSAQFQGRMDTYDFDATVGGWDSTLSPGNEQLYYVGSAAADTPGSRNLPGIKDPVVDALAASLARSRTREELVGRVRALDRVLLWGQHMIPLFHSPVDRIAHTTRLRRPAVTPLYGPVVESWWFAE